MSKIVLVICFISVISNCMSQEVAVNRPYNKNHITFCGGIALYSIFGSQVDLEASAPGSVPKNIGLTGLRFDFGYSRLISSRFFVNTGLSIVQKGGSQKGTNFIDYARLEKTYLQIPLLIGIKGANPKSRVGIAGGISLSSEISSKNSTTGSGWISKSFKSNTSTTSLLLTTFYEAKLTDKYLLHFRANYETDLSPTIERISISNKSYEIKTQGWSFAVGITMTN